MDRRHHPPMILVFNNKDPDLILACRKGTPILELLKVDFLVEGRWRFKWDPEENNVER